MAHLFKVAGVEDVDRKESDCAAVGFDQSLVVVQAQVVRAQPHQHSV